MSKMKPLTKLIRDEKKMFGFNIGGVAVVHKHQTNHRSNHPKMSRRLVSKRTKFIGEVI